MRLTFIYQSSMFLEREWISDIFRDVVGEEVIDGDHRVVLDNSLLVDSFPRRWPSAYYAKFRGRNAWLFHVSDEAYDGGYDCYKNFRGVFRNHWSGIFNPKRVVQLPLGYPLGLSLNQGGVEASRRSYLWSFLGQVHKSSRPEMTKAFLPLKPHCMVATDEDGTQSVGKQEYYRILRDSAFVPCPMGNVDLESLRTYESLETGAIPILERRFGFDYHTKLLGAHPLPTFSTWDRAARFVATIRNDPATMNELQAECIEWWARKKQSLREEIAGFVAAAPGDEAGPYYSWHYSLPGWQAIELLRHHTGAAVARRVSSQVRLIITKGKLRA